MSKSIRQPVSSGRLIYAIDSYKKRQAPLGKTAELAGVSISEMMDILAEFGVKSNVEMEDYLEGLKNLRKHW